MLTADSITEFLEVDLGVSTSDITPETALFSSQLVDSFSLVTLMMFIEREAGMRISPTDVTLDNIDSISKILAFVARTKT